MMQTQAPAGPIRKLSLQTAGRLIAHALSWLWVVFGLLALGWGGYGLYSELVRKAPLALIQVEGDISPADREELASRLKASVKGSYFGTDLIAIRDAVILSPWVESMSVQRRWPDGIRVLVIEKRQWRAGVKRITLAPVAKSSNPSRVRKVRSCRCCSGRPEKRPMSWSNTAI